MDRLALILVIIGALNWLLVGLFQFDLVANMFGGTSSMVSRIIYSLVGLAGLYCLPCCFANANRQKRIRLPFVPAWLNFSSSLRCLPAWATLTSPFPASENLTKRMENT